MIITLLASLFGCYIFYYFTRTDIYSGIYYRTNDPVYWRNVTIIDIPKPTRQLTGHVEYSEPWCINHSHPFIQQLHAGQVALLPGTRKLYIQLTGRLGNVLFQLASSYAIARDTHATLVVQDTPYLKDLKNQNIQHINTEELLKAKSSVLLFQKGKKDDEAFLKAVKHIVNGSVMLNHYLQQVNYFEGCAKEVREKLQLKVDVQHRAREALTSIAKSSNRSHEELTFVGIHVRRGDMASEQWFKHGYRVPGKPYFQKAMKYYKDKYKKVLFVVATNDKTWVSENLLGKDVYMSPLKSAAEDMALVSACNHTIISIGTFSWWCGFFNEGETVFYKDWIQPGSTIYKKSKYEERKRFPPHWLPLK